MKVKTLQLLCLKIIQRKLTAFATDFDNQLYNIYRGEKHQLPLHIPIFFKLHCIIVNAFYIWLDWAAFDWAYQREKKLSSYSKSSNILSERIHSIQDFYFLNTNKERRKRERIGLVLRFLIEQGIVTQECVKRLLFCFPFHLVYNVPSCLLESERDRKKYLYNRQDEVFCFKKWFIREKDKTFKALYKIPPRFDHTVERMVYYEKLYRDYYWCFDFGGIGHDKKVEEHFEHFLCFIQRDIDLCREFNEQK